MKSILMACSASLSMLYFANMLGSNHSVELGWDIKLAEALLSPWVIRSFFDPGHKKRKNLDENMKTPRLLNFWMMPLTKDANKTLHSSDSI